MRNPPRREQLVLEWTDRVQWDDLPVAARAELHGLLRELLRQAAHVADPAESGSHE